MSGKWNTFARWFFLVISIVVIFVGIKESVTAVDHEKNVMEQLKFADVIDGQEIMFSAWYAANEGSYYLVLPSAYMEKDFQTEILYEDKFYSVYIDDMQYPNGAVWSEQLEEEIHELKIEDIFGNIHMKKPFQVLVSEDVPSIMVTVEAKEELYKTEEYANKQYVEKGDIVLLDQSGKVLLNDTMGRFKVRGNLTSNFDKKPFTFTLSKAAALCGMSEAVNWHLLANATDGSHIRNQLMLDWADEMSQMYHPTGKHVDLFVNGEYQGLYFLTETVDAGVIGEDADSFDGMLMEMELDYRAVLEDNYVVTDRKHYWVTHDEMPLTQQELSEITQYLNHIESALYSKKGVSEISGSKLEELLDFDSWTDTWLLKEISSDHDLGTTSQFGVVKNWEERGILFAGPEWDFDGTLGNGMVPWARNPRNLVTAIPNTKGINSVSQNVWLSQMYHHEGFKTLLIQKFQEEVQPKIKRLLDSEIDDYAKVIRRAALLDSLRWNGNGNNYCFALPENYSLGEAKDYRKYDVLDQHVQMIKDFLQEKEQFLQELWIENAEFEVEIEELNGEGMNLQLNNNIYTWTRKDDVN